MDTVDLDIRFILGLWNFRATFRCQRYSFERVSGKGVFRACCRFVSSGGRSTPAKHRQYHEFEWSGAPLSGRREAAVNDCPRAWPANHRPQRIRHDTDHDGREPRANLI